MQEKKAKKCPVTMKKQKFIGTKEFVDIETGEVIPMQISQIEDRDFNFHKVWLQLLVSGLDDIMGQRLRLAFWVIEHLDKENKLVMTQRRIAQESGMSISTVQRTMASLQEGENPFLQKINSGAYRVNPDMIYKGSHNNRIGVIYDFVRTETSNKGKKAESQENNEKENNV